MPEGDSIHVLTRRLDRTLLGTTIARSDLRVPQLATRDLAGRRVLEHATHGKHLLTRLSGGATLHSHLLMDGSWTVARPGRRLPGRLMREVRVVLEVDTGATSYGLNLRLPVVSALLDQTRMAGLGNLWANELCFLVGRSPWTPVGEVDLVVSALPARPRSRRAGPHPTDRVNV